MNNTITPDFISSTTEYFNSESYTEESTEIRWSKSTIGKRDFVTHLADRPSKSHVGKVIKRYYDEKSNDFDEISLDDLVMSGKPVIKGTRIPVTLILAYLRDEENFNEILEDFPNVNKEQIVDSLNYIIKVIGDPYNEG